MPQADRLRRFHTNRQAEIDSAAQYRALADLERDDGVARVYRDMASVEEKHAGFWEDQLRQAGATPGPRHITWRARVLITLARRFGPQFVLPTIASGELRDRNLYASQPESQHTRLPAQERAHARVLQSMLTTRATGVPGSELARVEGRHRTVSSNALRAAVLGANDGLCSNLSLVMGMAGATPNGRTILLAGIAGLLAGSCSMALGEWVSVTSSRELSERELAIERDELEAAPEEEREELQLIYEAKGLTPTEALELSRQLLSDPRTALDVLSREELGVDPSELGGSARVAALTSFLLFAAGALVPVVPFVFAQGTHAVIGSLVLSSVGLFGIGAAITLFTGRPVWFSGGRQLLLGLAAAGVTFGVGKLIGVAIG